MLFPEIDGVKYSVVFFVKASEVQYQFISFKINVILVTSEWESRFNKFCFESDIQMADLAYK
jgi:hypothetical protein